MSLLLPRTRLAINSITIRNTIPLRNHFHTTSRLAGMSYEYLVQIPDFPNSLDKRLAVRPQHLKDITPKLQAGKIVLGGAMLSKQPKEGEAPDMTGSVMIIKADSEEEVRGMIENDVYTKGGAWDVENMKVWCFKTAVRGPQ